MADCRKNDKKLMVSLVAYSEKLEVKTISFCCKDSLGLNYKLLCFHAYAAQLCELCRDFVEETCEQLRPVIFSGTRSSGLRASLCNTFSMIHSLLKRRRIQHSYSKKKVISPNIFFLFTGFEEFL
jgi:hypothetical protein